MAKVANRIRVKAWLASRSDSEKEQDKFMNEIIDLTQELEEMYEIRWGEIDV